MYKIVILIGIILLPLFLAAKKLDRISAAKHKELYLDWDNDVFVFKDHYYTQGLHFFWVDPMFKKNPLNRVLPRLKHADYYFGVGMVQEMYTPKDITDTLLNTVDRPYAGTLYIRSFSISSNPNQRIKLTTQFDLGVLGPLSGAEQAQDLIHDWTESTPVGGWDFQVENRPYINYNILLEHGFISLPHFELIGNTKIRVGNIHDDLRFGLTLRTGRINNYFKGLNLANSSYSFTNGLLFSLFGGFNLNFVAYNATLMGGIIPPTSAHEFTFNDIENVVIDLHGGIVLSFKNFGIKGQLTWKSKEFKTAEDHGWGTIAMFYKLK